MSVIISKALICVMRSRMNTLLLCLPVNSYGTAVYRKCNSPFIICYSITFLLSVKQNFPVNVLLQLKVMCFLI